MLKPQGYDDVEAFGNSTFEKIELGGHIGIIKKAESEEYTTRDGKKMTRLCIYFDFTEEDSQPAYFANRFEMDKKQNPCANWRGIFRQNIPTSTISDADKKAMSFLKGTITAIEESNNFKWDWEPQSLVGKRVCCVFGREEFFAQTGDIKLATKCVQLRSLQALKDNKVKIPNVKLLDGTRISEEDYAKTHDAQQNYQQKSQPLSNLTDADMPF